MSLALCAVVRSLLQDVRSIQSDLVQSDLEDEGNRLSNQVIQLQPAFQAIVVSLSQAGLSPAVEQRLRPCQTEGHRRLKLAGIAAMRLKTAKQAKTIAAVRSQIGDHLLQLQPFVEAMAEELCNLSK